MNSVTRYLLIGFLSYFAGWLCKGLLDDVSDREPSDALAVQDRPGETEALVEILDSPTGKKNPKPSFPAISREGIMQMCGNGDPEGAWHRLQNTTSLDFSPQARFELQNHIVSLWVRHDVEAAVSEVTSHAPESYDPTDFMLVEKIASVAPLKAAEWVLGALENAATESGGEPVSGYFLGSVLNSIVAEHPEYVGSILARGPPVPVDDWDRWKGYVLWGWSMADPTATTAWITANEVPGKHRTELFAKQADAIRDTEDADAFFVLLATDSLTREERNAILQKSMWMANADLPGLLNRAVILEESETASFLNDVGRELFQNGFVEDGKMVIEELGRENGTSRVSPQMIASWAQHDPEGVGEWLLTLKDEEVKTHGVMNLSAILARQDPVAAEAYLANYPEGSREREVGAFAIAIESVSFTPERALGWFDSINDETLRRKFLLARVGQVTRFAPERAVELRQSSDSELREAYRLEAALQAALSSG